MILFLCRYTIGLRLVLNVYRSGLADGELDDEVREEFISQGVEIKRLETDNVRYAQKGN